MMSNAPVAQEVMTLENKKITKIILAKRNVTLQETVDTLNMLKERVGLIWHEHLSIGKLFSKGVPRSLTVCQKQQHFDGSESTLGLFRHDRTDLLRRYVIVNETYGVRIFGCAWSFLCPSTTFTKIRQLIETLTWLY